MQYLPPEYEIKVSSRALTVGESALARTDAAIFLIEETQAGRLIKSLPHASLWTALQRASATSSGPAPMTSRVANGRHTLVAVGFIKANASAFARLSLAAKLAREALQPGVASLQLHCLGFAADAQIEQLEGLLSAVLAGAAPMPERKRKPTPRCALRTVTLNARPAAEFTRAIAIARGNHLARWLTALPPNVLDCVGYRKALQQLARREGWAFRYYDESALRRLGAGAFLAVAQSNPHRGAGIVRLTYRPPTRRRGKGLHIALVGKGICFDTGGINLKPHKSMYLMHGDMQGSAVAVGTLLTLSNLQSTHTVDCWLALTENQIGPLAYRPQDIVTAMNGVTIQVVHSDAEGRMALADTLALASRAAPDLMLDYATLTGACVTALTDRYSGAFSNRPALNGWLQHVGSTSGERVWCFPMDEDFDTELDSSVADVLQCAIDGKGDHILAARFLSRFVARDIPWVHIDLSAAEHKGGLAHIPSEFTGFGVRFSTFMLDDVTTLARQLKTAAP